MKRIKWDECAATVEVSAGRPGEAPVAQQPFVPNVGREVSAKFKGITIFLKLLEQIDKGRFKAVVLNFEGQSTTYPEGISEADEVEISNHQICGY